jgi:hypothetical protein
VIFAPRRRGALLSRGAAAAQARRRRVAAWSNFFTAFSSLQDFSLYFHCINPEFKS